MLSSRLSPGPFVATLSLLLSITAVLASGQSANFNFGPGGFSATNVCANSNSLPEGCQIATNGSPSQPSVIPGGILRLNSANQNQHASAWFFTPQPLSTGFTTSFQFQISNTGACDGCGFPADGLALVIQGDPAGTGALGYTGNGQNIAYGNNDVSTASGPGAAIQNSLAIELDTFQNGDYGDPSGNHIAVQSCGPNNADTLAGNSADHNYLCPSGKSAKLALQSLPQGVSLGDGNIHTITVNYTAPGTCTESCNNFAVYLDSALILQTTLDITQQLFLTNTGNATGAFIGFTSATGAAVENNDIISWSFSQLPLAPITITQPLQTTQTTFNYTQNLSALVDYSQSGLPASAFNGVFMQGTAQSISDTDFANLVNNTPFQGATCLHQDVGSPGNPNFQCVVTSDLCTNSGNSTPAGANCPNTGTNALIGITATFHADPGQKPIINPAYLMAKDTALTCGSGGDNTCKGLQNIFQSITGDPVMASRTKDFNSLLVPATGAVLPSTATTTNPVLHQGWTNGSVQVTFNSTEIVPSNNHNPPTTLPLITGINFSVAGVNVPSPSSGTVANDGSITIPGAVEGATTVTFQAQDNAGSLETIITNSGTNVSTSLPTLTINVDLHPPTITGPTLPTNSVALGGTLLASFSCADALSGVALCAPSGSQGIFTSSPVDTTTAGLHTFTVNAQDVAGNLTSASVQYTVTPGTTTIALSPSANPSAIGQAVVFSVKVTGSSSVATPTGSVSIAGNAGESCVAALSHASAGVATGSCSITFNTPGGRTVTASYAGDTNFAGGSTSLLQNVKGPVITFSPSSVNFGTVPLFFVGARVIKVSNTGNAPLTITGVSIAFGPGTDRDDFGQINNCITTISPGGSCVIALGFLAEDLGPKSAAIVVRDNALGSPQQIPLAANVVKK